MSRSPAWNAAYREAIWARLSEPWDIIVVGGGITGAGILREAARLGLRALLIEQRDFAWGTSSRSSKLIHGGLRYLRQGQIGMTRDSVRERERLLREAPGLVEPLGFLLATFESEGLSRALYGLALNFYDWLAGRRDHRAYSREDLSLLAPHLGGSRLAGAYWYGDAQTDDARLVLRLLREACAAGAAALNYVAAEGLLREGGRVVGLRLRDVAGGRSAELRAGLVINATGAWADRLRGELGRPPAMRPLRGSHLVFPAWRLPMAQAIIFPHPRDRRPVFVFPWEGATIVGTTDVDHSGGLAEEPAISPAEAGYLLEAVRTHFPRLDLSLDDAVAAWAGVRPVVGSGRADPSKEPRDHVVWAEEGLLTVTGGKLTTFRLTALEALEAARPLLPDLPSGPHGPALDPAPDLPDTAGLDAGTLRRLRGRYGADAAALLAAAQPGELTAIAGTPTLWAELRWAARAEAVQHLDDLLLRRTRLGLLLPEGGAALLPTVRAICQSELGWDDSRWEAEEAAYRQLWRAAYAPPASVELAPLPPQKRRRAGQLILAGLALTLLTALIARALASRRRRS